MGRGPGLRVGAFIAATALLGVGCAAEPGMSPGDPGATTTIATAPFTTEPTTAGYVLPDLTARPISEADVLAMLPTGGSGIAESSDPTTEPMTNARLLVLSTLDPDDEAADVVRFGRLTGASGVYPQDDATAHVWIDVLSDAEAAHRYLLDYAGDVFKGTGGTHAPDATALTVAEFPMEVGEEAIGLDLSSETAHETAVVFRLGRIVVWGSIVRQDEADTRVALQYLAEDVAGRIVSTLTTGAPDLPRPDTPDHRFETTITVDATGTRYSVQSNGVVQGGDLHCSLRLQKPGSDISVSLMLIDGVLWSQHDDERRLVGGNLAERSLLGLCPPWPLDARDSGVTEVMDGSPTAHKVNGVDAFGYRSDATGLERVLGMPLNGVTVDAFSVWVADGVPWLVELSVIAQGDAAALVPLTGPGFDDLGNITVTVRHRVLDLGGRS